MDKKGTTIAVAGPPRVPSPPVESRCPHSTALAGVYHELRRVLWLHHLAHGVVEDLVAAQLDRGATATLAHISELFRDLQTCGCNVQRRLKKVMELAGATMADTSTLAVQSDKTDNKEG